MSDLNSILNALHSPPMRHAMFGHLPIALCVLGIPLALAAAVLPRNVTCRVMAIIAFALLTIAAFVTTNSGDAAHAAITAPLSQDVYALIDRHQDMAEKLWLFGGGVTVLLALSALRLPLLRTLTAWLAVVLSGATLVWVSFTADLGGQLVYQHGVGVPKTTALALAASPSATLAPAGKPAAEDPRIAFFRDTVQPILAENCQKCHNSARAARGKSGKLDQTSRETILQGGRSGPAIVPGKPEESLLIKRLKGVLPGEDPMPPSPNTPLTDDQIAKIEQWIRDGAAWTNIPAESREPTHSN